MPELPEVEVTRRRIGPLLVGRRIRQVRTTRDSYFFLTRPARLRARLTGRRIAALARHGKYLVAELDEGSRLVVHLGMTGQLFSSAATSPRLLSATRRSSLSPEAQRDFEADAHTHLQLLFDDGGPEVYFRDVRKFGKVLLLARGESHPRLARLGIDALEATGERALRGDARPQGVDQGAAARSGADHRRRQHLRRRSAVPRGRPPGAPRGTRDAPRVRRGSPRRSARCSSVRSRRAARASATTSRRTEATVRYQDERRVYARTGEPCLRCGSRIRRTIVAQRGTHYCPTCQR